MFKYKFGTKSLSRKPLWRDFNFFFQNRNIFSVSLHLFLKKYEVEENFPENDLQSIFETFLALSIVFLRHKWNSSKLSLPQT